MFEMIEKEPGTLSLAVSIRFTWTLYAMNLKPPQSVHSKLCQSFIKYEANLS